MTPSREDPDVTVVTVTYDSAGHVAAALASAREAAAAAGLDAEVIVVDNASADDSPAVVAAAAPEAAVIRNATNRGFGAANNQAFARARGRYWLLLNPDATLERDALGELVEFLDRRPTAAAVAPSIRGPGGSAESAGMAPSLRSVVGHFLFLNRLVRRPGPWRGFQLRRLRTDEPVAVDWVSAAAVLLRPGAVREIGGFDESIFLYGEDIDLCRRLAEAGWQVVLAPRAVAHHAVGQERVSTRWVDGLHGLHARTSSRPLVVLFDLALAVGLGIRALLTVHRASSVHHRRLRRSAIRAATLAVRCVAPGNRGTPRW